MVRCGLGIVALAIVLTGCSSTDSGQPAPTSPTVARESTSTTPAPVPRPGADCLRAADEAQQVRFGPHSGLGGYLVGSGDRYVVLAHQSAGDSCQMLPLARGLAAAGYHALAFDFPGTESSSQASGGRILAASVLSAVDLCRARHARSVSLVGASMGGYAVLNAALLADPPVSDVVSLSAPNAWDDPDGKPLDISALETPAQLWAARYDTSFADAARVFGRQLPSAQLIVAAGYGHGVELVPSALKRIVAFLDAHTPGR